MSNNIIYDKIKDSIYENFSKCPKFLQFSIRDFAVLPNGHFSIIQDNTIAVYNSVVSDSQNNQYVSHNGNKCIL